MTGRYWPLGAGRKVTSAFGAREGGFHFGVDFGRTGGSSNMAVFSVQAGTVVMAGLASGFGRWVVVDHPAEAGGGTTVYGHVVPEVAVGQVVAAGQRIAHIDPDEDTNGGVAPHLHLEWHRAVWVQPGPDRLDPLPLLSGAAEPPGGRPVATQLQADVTVLSPNDDGQRAPSNISLGIVHTNEGPPDGRVEDLLGWLAQERAQASYTLIVGGDGRIGRSNDDSYIPWAAGSPANERGLHLCFLGRAAQTRADWLSRPAQLAAGAMVLRDWSDRYGIPLVKLTGAQMRAGQRGFGGHVDTVDAWHATNHSDPGGGFPWDVVLGLAKAGGGKDAPMSAAEVKQIQDFVAGFCGPISSDVKDIREQLCGLFQRDSGQYDGWAQLGGRTVVDALGEILTRLDRLDGLGGAKAVEGGGKGE